MSEKGMRQVAQRFRRDMEGLGVGVSIQLPGRPPVEVVPPPDERRDMAVMEMQLSFEVGGQRPSKMKLAVTGKLAIDGQLLKGQRVALHVLDLETGELIADAPGTVVAVAFVDKTDGEGYVSTTREHKIAVDG